MPFIAISTLLTPIGSSLLFTRSSQRKLLVANPMWLYWPEEL